MRIKYCGLLCALIDLKISFFLSNESSKQILSKRDIRISSEIKQANKYL